MPRNVRPKMCRKNKDVFFLWICILNNGANKSDRRFSSLCIFDLQCVQNTIFGQQVHSRDNIMWFFLNVIVDINNSTTTDIFDIEIQHKHT